MRRSIYIQPYNSMRERKTSLLLKSGQDCFQQPCSFQTLQKRLSTNFSIADFIIENVQLEIISSQKKLAKQLSSKYALQNMVNNEIDLPDKQEAREGAFRNMEFQEMMKIDEDRFRELYEKNPFFKMKVNYQIKDIQANRPKTPNAFEEDTNEITVFRQEKRRIQNKERLFVEKWQPFVKLRA